MRTLLGFLAMPRRKRRLSNSQSCACEPLEVRLALSATAGTESVVEMLDAPIAQPIHDDGPGTHYPGDVLVTDTEILTHSEIIPRFVAQPTITAVRSGNWSDPTVWSLGRAPTDFDRVMIPEHVVLNYSTLNNIALDALEINGSLIFSTTVNTRLRIATITVMPTGTLEIGTPDNPVAADVKAEILFTNTAPDLAIDPRQYGTGLLVLGKVTMHGAEMPQTWSRLTFEPRAGNTALQVEPGAAAGWRAGDTLVLPDTRQYLTTDSDEFMNNEVPPQWEQVTIARIVGDRVYLTKPLEFDHLGGRNIDGQLELMPHVADLSRNVVLRSEYARGMRGHTFYTARAEVDIQFVRFQDLGRTSGLASLDSTTFDAAGNVIRYGFNQVGRYAVHIHHLMGPENPTNTGYQFKFVGNTIDGSRKWSVAVHDSSWGLIDRNVAYNGQGAGFVTEDGTEIGNVFSNNIAIRMQGTHNDGKDGTAENDYGRGGSGFWFRNGGNIVVGNVAANNTYAGFVFDGYNNTETFLLPAFRGANKHEPGEGVVSTFVPSRLFVNNETYGLSMYGFWAAYITGNNLVDGGAPSTTIYNLRIWNVTHSGVVAYHTNKLAFDKLLILGNLDAQDRNHEGTRGMDFQDYENRNLVIRNSRIEGVRYGIMSPRNDGSRAGIDLPTVIENTILKNYINILVSPPEVDKYSNGNVLIVRNVKFVINPRLPVGPEPVENLAPPTNIYMRWSYGEGTDYTQRSIVKVYSYNQVAGDDFQVFYREQASSNIMPRTSSELLSGSSMSTIGAPAAGLTNAQSWASYNLATGGGLLPAGASASRSTINGLIAPIQAAVTTPKLVLVTPWANAVVTGVEPLRIRYNILGNLPAGASVYVSLDGGEAITGTKSLGLYKISPGTHSLKVYIGDSSGRQVSGTAAIVRSFVMQPLAVTATTLLADQVFSDAALEEFDDMASAIALSTAARASTSESPGAISSDIAARRNGPRATS